MIMNRKQRRSHIAPFKIHSKAIDTKQLKEEVLDDWSIKFFVEWYASTTAKDWSWDIVEVSAFDLDRYMQNPVIKIWHKRWEENNIWYATDVNIMSDGMYIKACMILSPEIEMHKSIIHWLRHNLIKGFSIGFIPMSEYYDSEKQANVITKLELYEISLVDIPDNPLTVMKALEAYRMIKAQPWDLRVWDFVSWSSSWGTARGRIIEIENREGFGFTPTWSDVEITADVDDPVALITLYRDDEETDQNVVHKFSTLTKIQDIASYQTEEEEKNTDDLDEVYAKYTETVNMSASELQARSETECSQKASLDRSPITRNLRLLSKKKDEWTAEDVRDANKTIAFVARMKANLWGDNVVTDENGRECGTKAYISLKNWAYDDKKEKSLFDYDLSKMTLEEIMAKKAELDAKIKEMQPEESTEEGTEETSEEEKKEDKTKEEEKAKEEDKEEDDMKEDKEDDMKEEEKEEEERKEEKSKSLSPETGVDKAYKRLDSFEKRLDDQEEAISKGFDILSEHMASKFVELKNAYNKLLDLVEKQIIDAPLHYVKEQEKKELSSLQKAIKKSL